jgi:hypothetical protein
MECGFSWLAGATKSSAILLKLLAGEAVHSPRAGG